MYGMLRADCTDSQTVFSTGSLLTSRCLIRRDGMAGVPEDCASKVLNALHRPHCVFLAFGDSATVAVTYGPAGRPDMLQ